MIVVLTSCRYFKQGFNILVEQVKKEHLSFSQVIFSCDISSLSEKVLSQAKAVVVDYGQPDIQQLVSLLDYKNKYPASYIVLITREACFENIIDNILINAVSDFTIDCVTSIRKLTSCLENFARGTQPIVITKNMRWYHIEKEKNLTKKETSLLPYIISGKNNKEISRYVSLSGKTISHHRRSIYHKFHVNNLTGLFNAFEHYV